MRKLFSWIFGLLLSVVIIVLGGLIVLSFVKGYDATVEIVSNLTKGKWDVSELVDNISTREDVDKLKDTLGELGEKTMEIKDGAVSLAETITDALKNTDYDISDQLMFSDDYEISEGSNDKMFDLGASKIISIEAGGCQVTVNSSTDSVSDEASVAIPKDRRVQVKSSEGVQFQCYESEGSFYIKVLSSSEVRNKSTMEIRIPDSFNGNLKAEVGGGSLKMADFTLDTCEFHAEAGEIELERLNSNVAVLNAGAGSIELEDVTLGQMAAIVGGGNISGNVKLLYAAEMNCSVGNINLTLEGSFKDYNYELTAVGNIDLNGTTYRGSAEKETIDNGSMKKIGMTSNLGNIKIGFTD